MNQSVMTIVGIIFMMIPLIFIGIGIRQILRSLWPQQPLTKGQETLGTITDKFRKEHHHVSSHDHQHSQSRCYTRVESVVKYQFTALGQPYEGQFRYQTQAIGHDSKRDTVYDSVDIGDTVAIRYDSNRPKRNCLANAPIKPPASMKKRILLGLFGLFFILFPLLHFTLGATMFWAGINGLNLESVQQDAWQKIQTFWAEKT